METELVEDDPSIRDEAQLWRRINPNWMVFDENQGRSRVSSQAFQNLEGDKLSVLLEELVRETGRRPEDLIASFPGFGLATISAGFARELQQGVIRAPEPDEPAHSHLVGKKSKSVQKALARHAEWVVVPPGPAS